MSNDLVKGLQACWNATRGKDCHDALASVPTELLERAIAFISSHDSVRDRALEEACWTIPFRLDGLTGRDITDKIRALKSAPAPQAEPKVHKRKDGNAFYYTDDTRGTVADRRKQACSSGAGRNREIPYGRRSNDRARWTGEAAPVVEVFKGCPEKQKPGGCQLHNLHCGYPACDTQPAQEAPQPEKPGLTYSAAFKAEFVDRKAFGHPDIPTNCDRPTWSHYYWLLRALDARQGEK